MVFRLLVRLVQHIPLKVIRCSHIDRITPESFTKSRFPCTTCTKTAELQKGMITLTDEAKEARRAYQRKWRKDNRTAIREYQRNWRNANPDRVKQYQEEYWARKAQQNQTEGGAV